MVDEAISFWNKTLQEIGSGFRLGAAVRQAKKGVVRGLVVRATSVVAGVTGGLKSMFGGDTSKYEKVCEKARDEAFRRMVEHAKQVGADAVIGMRYDATAFIQGSTEALAYGTAVRIAE